MTRPIKLLTTVQCYTICYRAKAGCCVRYNRSYPTGIQFRLRPALPVNTPPLHLSFLVTLQTHIHQQCRQHSDQHSLLQVGVLVLHLLPPHSPQPKQLSRLVAMPDSEDSRRPAKRMLAFLEVQVHSGGGLHGLVSF
jgi:hypothetical protein